MAFHRHRFLKPENIVRLERFAQTDGRGHIESAVAVDQDLDIGSDRLANRRNALGTKVLCFGTEFAAQVAIRLLFVLRLSGIEFQRFVAGVHDRLHVQDGVFY